MITSIGNVSLEALRKQIENYALIIKVIEDSSDGEAKRLLESTANEMIKTGHGVIGAMKGEIKW